VGNRFRKLRRKHDQNLSKPPLVIFNRACTKIAFADFPVIFQDTLRTISGPKEDADLLLFLAAVLNSPLCLYFLFHTTANLGIERETALLDEYMRVPFPLPEQTRRPDVSRKIVKKVATRLREARKALGTTFQLTGHRDRIIGDAKADATKLVFDYFQLSGWERQLVEDTVEIFRHSATPDSLAKAIGNTSVPLMLAAGSTYSPCQHMPKHPWNGVTQHSRGSGPFDIYHLLFSVPQCVKKHSSTASSSKTS
jgi:hypothetical protein